MLPKQYGIFFAVSTQREEGKKEGCHIQMRLLYFAWKRKYNSWTKTTSVWLQKPHSTGFWLRIWRVENSHCCLSCSQSISQLQVKPKQETQRHFRVNGQQQLKRNGYASAPSWDSKENCLPTPETNPLQPNTTAAPVPKQTFALHICHAHNLTTLPRPDTKDDGWPTGTW